MKTETTDTLFRQCWNFVLHLRWHYQLGILSGGFLLGGFLSHELNWPDFLLQFANVHLLLFGGATAYNSYWDKDTGPIGGLKHPPKMTFWMWPASMALQLAGLLIALPQGMLFSAIYVVSMILFWLYSSPLTRWKGKPLRSLIAIGISTGTGSLLLGYLAAGSELIPLPVASASVGVALIVLSLYPISQIYQLDEDRQRGDRTFAAEYGFMGILRFFEVVFLGGLILISLAMLNEYRWLGVIFLVIGAGTGFLVRTKIVSLRAEPDDYQTVMRIKMGTSLAFVVFLLIILFARHADHGIFSGLELLLQ